MTYLQTIPEYGLKLDFPPKFPFRGGLGQDWWSFALGSFPLAEQLGLSKSTGLRFSNFLEDSVPAFAGADCHCHMG